MRLRGYRLVWSIAGLLLWPSLSDVTIAQAQQNAPEPGSALFIGRFDPNRQTEIDGSDRSQNLRQSLAIAAQAQLAEAELIELINQITAQYQTANELNDDGRFEQAIAGYQTALGLAQSALALAQEADLANFELVLLQAIATTYIDIATTYRVLGEIAKLGSAGDPEAQTLTATQAFQQELAAEHQAIAYLQSYADLAQQREDAKAQATARQLVYLAYSGLGYAHTDLGQFSDAIAAYEQALVAARGLGDTKAEAQLLVLIANCLIDLSQYSQALDRLQAALPLAEALPGRHSEGSALERIGYVLKELGQPEAAIAYYQRALAIATTAADDLSAVNALIGLGTASQGQGNDDQALESYRQALAIAQALETHLAEPLDPGALAEICSISQLDALDPSRLYRFGQTLCLRNARYGQSLILNNTAVIYVRQQRYSEALALYQQALALHQDLEEQALEAVTRGNIGILLAEQGDDAAALSEYQQALTTFQALGHRTEQAWILGHMGALLTRQDQPELAITFYKQSINITESIRGEIQGLSQDLQQSYTDSIADTYRDLADLLLQQDRVLEAQQVLDLLRVQELDNYLRNVRGNAQTHQGVVVLQPEQKILERYQELQVTATQLGSEIAQLRQVPEAERTPAQTQRLTQLIALQDELSQQFNDFARSEAIEQWLDQLSRTAQRQMPNLEDLSALQSDLQQVNAVLLYPLVLEDRIELIMTLPTAESVPIRRTVQDVGRVELNRVVTEFRQALTDPDADALAPAQQLYDWLIRPLEAELDAIDIQTLIYSPDGQLRYIPLAALHDGDQWLTQRYQVNNITAKSLTNLTREPQIQPSILAGAFADPTLSHPVRLTGTEDVSYPGLPFAGREVENLVAQANATAFIDLDFSLETMRPLLNDYNIVHFATHAGFVSGVPEQSFILFGNGDHPTLRDIENWTLNNIDLVVLSACDTGLGGLGNGEEVLGLGYVFQDRGANAVIASLWSVDDGGTQVLMNAFYDALQRRMTKTEAVQAAQIALLEGNFTASGVPRGATIEVVSARTGLPSTVADNLAHPYYWAPFILIGNGL